LVGIVRQVVQAAKLDVAFYQQAAGREAAAEGMTVARAMVVVLLSGLAAGLGVYGRLGLIRAVGFAVIELAGWFAWAVLMYLIATKLLPRPGMSVDIGAFLRTVGFSSAPGLIRLVGLVPRIDVILFFVALVWMLMAAIVAVKVVFQYTGIWQAVAVVVIAWVIVRIAQRLLFAIL
jgi:hypothetical protein